MDFVGRHTGIVHHAVVKENVSATIDINTGIVIIDCGYGLPVIDRCTIVSSRVVHVSGYIPIKKIDASHSVIDRRAIIKPCIGSFDRDALAIAATGDDIIF